MGRPENRGIVLLIRQIPPDLFRECLLEGKPLAAADIAGPLWTGPSCTVAVMEFVNLLAMSEPAPADVARAADDRKVCRVISDVIREGSGFEIRSPRRTGVGALRNRTTGKSPRSPAGIADGSRE